VQGERMNYADPLLCSIIYYHRLRLLAFLKIPVLRKSSVLTAQRHSSLVVGDHRPSGPLVRKM